MSPPAAAERPLSTRAICIAGATGLAVAMGIGRFVFTPLLPLMQREGLLSVDAGALLAAANYLGYLLGQLGAVAAVLSALVASQWRRDFATASRPRVGIAVTSIPHGSWPFVLCYGALGFGYILPATYLPALARDLIDDPRLFGLVWPVFGLAAAASTLLAGRALRRWHRLRIGSASHALMAAGCALPLLTRSGAGLALSALFVGGTFMVATMVGLQQARSLAPLNPTPLLGRMSAAFAGGQIAGPLVVLGLAQLPLSGWSGIELTLALATATLLVSAFWLRRCPALQAADEAAPAARAP